MLEILSAKQLHEWLAFFKIRKELSDPARKEAPDTDQKVLAQNIIQSFTRHNEKLKKQKV